MEELWKAISEDNVAPVERFVQECGNPNRAIEVPNGKTNPLFQKATPIISIAAFYGASQVFDAVRLLNASLTEATSNGVLPVHFWAASGDDSIFDILDSEGVNFEEKDRAGNTVFHYAAMFGVPSVFEKLSVRGMDMNPRNNARMSPFGVLGTGCGAIPRAMMEALNEYLDVNEPKMVSEIIEKGWYEVLDVIVERIQDIDKVTVHHVPAVLWAARNKKSEVLKILVRNAESMYVRDVLGRTVLHLVANTGDDDVARWVVEHMPKELVNLPTAHGMTALHIAKNRGHEAICKCLEEAGGEMFAPLEQATQEDTSAGRFC